MRWTDALGDERLARMVEHGSDPAFAAIYGRYAPLLQGYCRSLLRDEEEAGDALQNTMLKALQALRRAGRTGPLRPWLFRIAHNESVSILRARTRRPGPLDEGMVAGADDAFRHAAAREQLAALLEDLDHLTEHQRGALVMRELGGLSYDEIGAALDTTPLAARQAVFVARKRLSNGRLAPRRLRPALRQLIPAPAGAALWGWLGGGSVSLAGKALVGTAAVVSVGVGSLELAVPDRPAPKRQVVAAAPAPRHQRPAATATPTPVARTTSRSRVAAAEGKAAPRVTFVAVTQRAAPKATPTPTPTPTPAAEDTTAPPETTPTPHPDPPPPRPGEARPQPSDHGPPQGQERPDERSEAAFPVHPVR